MTYPKFMINTWDLRFLELARNIASWSKDPSTKIGAVAVGSKRQILAQGYNGFPRGVADTQERLNDRETKYKFVVHAEMNCIYNAVHNGVSLDGAKLYVTGLPVCSECAKGVIQAGIKHVVMEFPDHILDGHWGESFKLTEQMFREAKIGYDTYEKPNT